MMKKIMNVLKPMTQVREVFADGTVKCLGYSDIAMSKLKAIQRDIKSAPLPKVRALTKGAAIERNVAIAQYVTKRGLKNLPSFGGKTYNIKLIKSVAGDYEKYQGGELRFSTQTNYTKQNPEGIKEWLEHGVEKVQRGIQALFAGWSAENLIKEIRVDETANNVPDEDRLEGHSITPMRGGYRTDVKTDPETGDVLSDTYMFEFSVALELKAVSSHVLDDIAQRIAKKYNQESVLVIDNNLDAERLVYQDGKGRYEVKPITNPESVAALRTPNHKLGTVQLKEMAERLFPEK